MSDNINPDHYRLGNVQPVDIAEHLSFSLGNVVKYVSRAGRKGDALEDLQKARWYLDREIARIAKNERPENDEDWMEMALRVAYLGLKDARVGTMERTPDGTIWAKTKPDKWETFGTRQHGEATDDFGLAERLIRD